MADDMPADVRASLSQLLSNARQSVRAGDTDTAASLLDTASTVAEHKLPDGDRRDRLRFGCSAARETLSDRELAAAYIEAMERRIPEV
ncbi:uncharacterized protein NP_4084A [Natronomonas pharaonis DSM 2160]|uniref:DUF8101 domain-containing protein n=1 Tax=Natronomonas pharaonis (strain ATCC 35678 / DSM 2160 / CIP 103997 / JCM 8858 / NBRC 14720 / NCIMB 2260 / Gabara) TaxID=348780 RepID=A0A1U7EY53_NATPD|nr:hypothetical protein [Natronomonas pharaonis]CAI50133.1 uncharacterized protein NP_4084A [Natronomonas pharaonis DSM 2160]